MTTDLEFLKSLRSYFRFTGDITSGRVLYHHSLPQRGSTKHICSELKITNKKPQLVPVTTTTIALSEAFPLHFDIGDHRSGVLDVKYRGVLLRQLSMNSF